MGERLPCKQEVTSSNLVFSIAGREKETSKRWNRIRFSQMYLENRIQEIKR